MSEIGATDGEIDAADDVLFTRGIGSPVYDPEDRDSLIGHVALIDADDCDLIGLSVLAQKLDGLTAIFESSTGSYHLWDLTPRSFEQTIMDVLDLDASDAEHVKQSRRRHSWVVRAAAKVREDGSTYKPAPTLIDVYDDGESDVSRGHHSLLTDQYDVDPVDEDRLIGADQIETHSYMTVTDAAKEAIRR